MDFDAVSSATNISLTAMLNWIINPTDIMDKKIIAVIAVAIIVVAGCGAFALSNGGDDRDSKPIDELAKSGNYLKIFGNADGDYRLDNNDIKIIQDYVDGKTDKSSLITVTEKDNGRTYYLADANLDGEVDASDIAYLKGIIDRTDESMNLIDTFGHLCTVPLKIDRIACDYFATAELLNLVGVQNKIVACTNALFVLKDYYLQNADTSKMVNFFSRVSPDYEKVAEANPDVWVVSEDYGPNYKDNTKTVVVGLDTLIFDFDNIYAASPIMSALLAGYMFDNVDKAVEYVNWYLDTWNMLYSKTSKLSSEDRPVVFYTGYSNCIKMDTDGTTIKTTTNTMRIFPDNTVPWQAVKLAGGTNLLDKYPGEITKKPRPTSGVYADMEWFVEQNYDYAFFHCTKYTGSGTVSAVVPDHGYLCDDPSEYRKAQSTLADISYFADSCKAGNMYLTPGDFMNGASGGLMNAILVAVVIHPDLFPDLDLDKEFQKYIDLMGFDYDLSKHGTFFVKNA